jgi:hypothetical protein
LSGVVLHELRWNQYFESILAFRKELKRQFDVGIRDEFHAAHFFSRPGVLA